jgi:hypothetical protein
MVQHIQIEKHRATYKHNHKQKSPNHLSRYKKVFDKMQHSFLMKTQKKLRVEELYLNMKKAICNRPIANIILNGEKN